MFKKAKPNNDLKISSTQLLEIPFLKHCPFQKTLLRALNVEKDDLLLNPKEKVRFDKLKNDEEFKKQKDILTLNALSGRPLNPKSENDFMFDENVMKDKFNVKNLTNGIKQERLLYDNRRVNNINNNYITSNDKDKDKEGEINIVDGWFNDENPYSTTDNLNYGIVGKQKYGFDEFCIIMRVFSDKILPEEKITCKFLSKFQFILNYSTLMKMI